MVAVRSSEADTTSNTGSKLRTTSAPTALFSPARVNALRESGLRSNASIDWLDRVVRIVAAACEAPVALVLLVDDRSLHLPSSHGLDERARNAVTTLTVPLARTVAAQTILDDGPVAISDLRQHLRYRVDPLANAGMVGVLAVPLRIQGQVVGLLAACDRVPCEWDTEQRETLESLALLTAGRLLNPGESGHAVSGETLATHLPDAVIQIDHDGRIIALNEGASAMLQLPMPHAVGAPLASVLPVSPLHDDLSESIWTSIHEQRETSAELARPDVGDWIELRSFPTRQGATIVMRDVTERKQRESRLFHEAYHDPLTQLPNRRLLLDRMQQALARARRNGVQIAVLFLDLDNFKRVNDSLGHDAGDQLLIEVARRLRTLLREEDTAARLGGDEFVVLLPHVPDPSGAIEVAQRIIDSLHQEMAIGGHRIAPVTSIGVAMSTGPGDSPDDLLARADAAMYQSKARGKNRYTLAVTPERSANGEPRPPGRSSLSTPTSHLTVLFQPQLSIPSDQVAAVEAFVHWHHFQRGLLPRDDLLAVARRIGADQDVDRLVIRQSLAALRAWESHVTPAQVRLAINLSMSTMSSPGIASEILSAIASSAVDPRRIELEIPADLLHAPCQIADQTLLALARAGCGVIVDDPDGTALAHGATIKWPATGVKIRVNALRRHRQAINRLRASGIQLTAIDVDTPHLLEQARALRVDRVQGRSVCAPMPAEGIDAMLSRQLRTQHLVTSH